jgi:ABC-type oligopeptide transport system substrate-binding subunit
MSPVPDELSTRQLRRYSTTLNLAHPLTLHYYGMNYLAKPFDNVAIRRAFALALDKRELAEFSQGLPTDSLLGSWSLDTTPAGGGDLLHAKESLLQGLQEEGLSSVSQLPPIVFTYEAGQPNLASEVELARLRWQEVLDIKVTLRAVANLDQTLVATHGNASLQLWAADYTPSYLDPYALVGSPFAQGSPLNAVNYGQNTSADAASQQALQNSLSTYLLASISVRGRLQIYQQAEQSLLADVAWLPIYMVTHAYAVAQGALPPFGRDGNPWGAMDYCTGIPPC